MDLKQVQSRLRQLYIQAQSLEDDIAQEEDEEQVGRRDDATQDLVKRLVQVQGQMKELEKCELDLLRAVKDNRTARLVMMDETIASLENRIASYQKYGDGDRDSAAWVFRLSEDRDTVRAQRADLVRHLTAAGLSVQ